MKGSKMMKKLALICACLMMPMAANAACVGGTEIRANTVADNPNGNCTDTTCNGHTFCKSNGTMNWWSAFNWCASNGRSLASFSTMCPGIQTSPNNVTGACPNLQGVGGSQWAWSSLAYGSKYAILVNLSSGAVSYGHRTNSNYAFCE
ncbi:MAG: hypothetical protein IJV07_03190 [Alphaproteobacteria bacterium]|nr:hypothetical protein [Alphaproteobacteria bacterium]